MPRKKKVVDGNFVVNEATGTTEHVEHELDMNHPVEETSKMKVSTLIEFAKDATVDEIKKFLIDNKLIYRDYVPYSELFTIAGNIIQDTCYDKYNRFEVNTPLINLHTKVQQFILYVDMDYEDIKYSDLYDALREYQIDTALEEYLCGTLKENKYNFDDVHENIYYVVDDRLNDIKYNKYSVEASMRSIAESIASIIDTFNDGVSDSMRSPELAKAIVEELKNIKE